MSLTIEAVQNAVGPLWTVRASSTGGFTMDLRGVIGKKAADKENQPSSEEQLQISLDACRNLRAVCEPLGFRVFYFPTQKNQANGETFAWPNITISRAASTSASLVEKQRREIARIRAELSGGTTEVPVQSEPETPPQGGDEIPF